MVQFHKGIVLSVFCTSVYVLEYLNIELQSFLRLYVINQHNDTSYLCRCADTGRPGCLCVIVSQRRNRCSCYQPLLVKMQFAKCDAEGSVVVTAFARPQT